MNIKIRKLDISINTKFLSGGEETLVKRLAKKARRGIELNSRENNFLLSMSRRCEVFLQNKINTIKVEFCLN